MIMRALILTFTLCAAQMARSDVVVFAAASLKEPLDELAAAFGDVVVSYSGSATVARQVSFGAPADLVLLANADWMDVLAGDGHIDPETVSDFASNALVLIGAADAADVSLNPNGILSALGDGRLAVGLTSAVPAGIYAKAALTELNLWESVVAQLAEVDNVRSAMTLVARGQAPLGIVYATDARASPGVRIVGRFPADTHPPIRYVGALTLQADDRAKSFWDFVAGANGQVVFAEFGFLPPIGVPE